MDYAKDPIFPEVGAFPTEQALSDYVLGILSEWFSIETEIEGRYRGQEPVRIDAVLRPIDPGPWADDNPAFGVEFKVPKPRAGVRDFFQWAAQAVDYTHAEWNGYGRLQVFVCPSPILAVMSTPSQLRDARQRRTELAGIEHARELTSAVSHATRHLADDPSNDQDDEGRALKMQAATIARYEAEHATAVAEGFQDALDRSVGQAAITARTIMQLLGQLNVGELMPTKHHGWSLLRSGERLWCQDHGPARSGQSLVPKLGSR